MDFAETREAEKLLRERDAEIGRLEAKLAKVWDEVERLRLALAKIEADSQAACMSASTHHEHCNWHGRAGSIARAALRG